MSFRFAKFAVSPLLSAAMLAGCTTSGGNSASGGLFAARAPATPYISALQGGIVGRTALEIGASDRQRALEAEYRALEGAAVGQPVTWTGREAKGEVVASAPFQVGSQNCRQYSHTLNAGGREVKARGAACRNSDGTWTPLT
jgi:surface antigen